jgi:hypothetical protein
MPLLFCCACSLDRHLSNLFLSTRCRKPTRPFGRNGRKIAPLAQKAPPPDPFACPHVCKDPGDAFESVGAASIGLGVIGFSFCREQFGRYRTRHRAFGHTLWRCLSWFSERAGDSFQDFVFQRPNRLACRRTAPGTCKRQPSPNRARCSRTAAASRSDAAQSKGQRRLSDPMGMASVSPT